MKQTLNLPPVKLRLREEGGITKVFDPLRNKYVAFTPEENVRQHFTSWLARNFHYPPALMANEIGIDVNGTRKRCDTVVFGRDGHPLLIVEYKSPDVNVTQDVFDQIVRYNMELKARYLIVSNGLSHYCCRIDYERFSYHFIPRIPDYNDITTAFSAN
ncbi:MAG: type I restriction enzyme HsdR N-terminal domain-containing protein [Candidatus Amulumruptor caecigallinarius]|nr:type I restriction enzyme HsdR N-terminal domain-containing protein [Candidatus Amulumruptor caecigallinarius]